MKPCREDVEGAYVVPVPPVARAVGVTAPQQVVDILSLAVLSRLDQTVPPAAGAHRRCVCLVHLEVVKWLHENRTEGCSTYVMNYAAENGHLEVVKWLHENR